MQNPVSFTALFGAKVSDSRLHRKVALEGHRFTPQEALDAGFVDHLVNGDTAAVLAKAEQVAESVSHLAKGGVWSGIKVCRVAPLPPSLIRFYCSLICIVRHWK